MTQPTYPQQPTQPQPHGDAAQRARELEEAQNLIDARREELLLQLSSLRAEEEEAEKAAALLAVKRREVQQLAFQLYDTFHVPMGTLQPIVGRSRQKIHAWFQTKPWTRTGPSVDEA